MQEFRGDFQQAFARALLDPDLAPPDGVVSQHSKRPHGRFAVYRNNVVVALVGALEARFPATRQIVGEEFFAAMARVFAAANPPRSPLMMAYGDDFPGFIAGFSPAAEVSYLADVARLEAARTRAYHAADAWPLPPEVLAATLQERPESLCFSLHPAVEIVGSAYPIVTIWAMNAGEAPLAPVEIWSAEDALVSRPALDVEVRRLPRGGAAFLEALRDGAPLGAAAASAHAAAPDFDLSDNLARLFGCGLVIAVHHTA